VGRGSCDVSKGCKGGCYYNALASGDGIIDPLCEGYKEIYGFVRQKALHEISRTDDVGEAAREYVVIG